MIDNCLDILKSWCKPLGDKPAPVLTEYVMAVCPGTNPSFRIYANGGSDATIRYIEGGEQKEVQASTSGTTITIPADPNTSIYIYAEQLQYVYAQSASNIALHSDYILGLVVGTVLAMLDMENATMFNSVIHGTLPNLWKVSAHVDSTQNRDAVKTDLCPGSSYGGTKVLYLYPDDTYYNEVKTSAINDGWTVYDL